MATYTEHYGLHQWEAADDFLRTDFNTDFQKIDGALGTLAEEVAGKNRVGTQNRAGRLCGVCEFFNIFAP